MFIMQEIGKKIVDLRKKKNMTQMELSDLMGISFQAVSNWERGESMPDISKLPELAQILEVTVDKLLGEEDKREESLESTQKEQQEGKQKGQREKNETEIEIKEDIQQIDRKDNKSFDKEDIIMIRKEVFPLFRQTIGSKELVNQQELEIDGIENITVTYSCDNIIFYPSENKKLVLKEYMNEDKEKYYAHIIKEKDSIEIINGEREIINRLDVLAEVYIPVDFHGSLNTKVNSGCLKFELEQKFFSFQAKSSSGGIKINSLQAEQSDIQANSGSIKIERVNGNFNISTNSGSIKITECKGKGVLSANSGSIRFEVCDIEGEIKSHSGSIHGEILYTDKVELNSSSGSIKIRELKGDFLITSSSGSISVESCDGNGELNTSSGSIKTRLKKVNGNIKAHTTSGSIKVSFQEDINATIEATCGSGTIKVQDKEGFERGEHFAKGVLGKGGETKIMLETHSGSIKIE